MAVLGIVLVAEVMDLLDSTITIIAAPTISSSLHGGPGLIKHGRPGCVADLVNRDSTASVDAVPRRRAGSGGPC
jgi:hypothetical protein